MRFPRSIRWRLQLWYGALLVAVLCGFGFTAYHLESARQFRWIDEGLQQRLAVLLDVLRSAPNRGPSQKPTIDVPLNPAQAALFAEGTGYYYVIWRSGKAPAAVSADAPPDVPRPVGTNTVARMRDNRRELFLFAAPVDCVLVGRSIAAEQAEMRKLAAALAAVGGVVLAAGLFGGLWLITHAIRPVEEISATAAKIAAGDLSQRIHTADPDTELGRLAGVLNATFARLDAAFTQQARFTEDAAHELRTPVAVILTHTQNGLASDDLNEEHREAFAASQRAAQRMRCLIESLLELARLDAGQEPLRRAACDLARITAECLALIGPLAGARRIRIESELPATACSGDAERLAQVVTNLLSNAIEYNHDGGQVRLTTRRIPGTVILTVTNTGPGIGEADLPHIFERFTRADKARTGTAGHSGLGLAITQAIVQAHGGSINAASQPGTLTTFTVRLPA